MACSDEFLEDKKNYDNIGPELYDTYSGARARLNDVYVQCLPNIQATRLWQFPSMGNSDNFSMSTEEYTGLSPFTDPREDLNTNSGTAQIEELFQGTSAYTLNATPWGRIRNCNDLIEGVSASSLSQAEKDEILGQAHFLRAWCYYYLFRYYGGVPIIKTVQNVSPESVTPRSSAKDVYQFIIEDLELAAQKLRDKTTNQGWGASDWGRVTTASALALEGRVRLLWASPLFNRDNDQSRWQDAYKFMKDAMGDIEKCGCGLANEKTPGVNGQGWADMFLAITGNPEAVFCTLYNDKDPDGVPDYQRNNVWEQQARPANTLGNTGRTPSAAMIDLFPMSDGKRPSTYTNYKKVPQSDIPYDAEHPFMDRDPRFYRTFAFPGVHWYFNGDPNTTSSCNPYIGKDYCLWNYVWYNDPEKYDDPASSTHFGADNLLDKVHGMYVRKFTDDRTDKQNYIFHTAGKNVGFRNCQTSTIEIRFAEVLLNLAEAACMTNNIPEAIEYMKRIRVRAGYPETATGLDGITDQAACMSAILYERQIEFAYEGKRFEDMRRWLLFDGGTGFEAIGAKKLTGWGGNTLTWLGMENLYDGNHRLEGMIFRLQDQYNYTDKTSGKDWPMKSAVPAEREKDNPDPLLGGNAPKMTRAHRDSIAIDANMTLNKLPFDQQLENLKSFYNSYLKRKTLKGDNYNSDNTPLYRAWKARYYFFGLTQSAQINNPQLKQTIGWEDYQNGGANGTFDPLAE